MLCAAKRCRLAPRISEKKRGAEGIRIVLSVFVHTNSRILLLFRLYYTTRSYPYFLHVWPVLVDPHPPL